MTKVEENLVHRRRGRWIREGRERRGMNLDTLAKLLGYADGQGTVSLWEKGERPVPASKFQMIARVLSLPDRFLVRPPDDGRGTTRRSDPVRLRRRARGLGPGGGARPRS